jgi:sporulation protein YlmC with PRC-barrel domain
MKENKMPQFKSIDTILGTNYTVGDSLAKGKVSDITLDENWGEHLVVTVWVRRSPEASEISAVIIPYHAVELLIK